MTDLVVAGLTFLTTVFGGIRWLMQVNHKQAKENATLKNELTTRSINELRVMLDGFGKTLIKSEEQREADKKEFKQMLQDVIIDFEKANSETQSQVREFEKNTDTRMRTFESRLTEIVSLSKDGDVFLIRDKKAKDKKQ